MNVAPIRLSIVTINKNNSIGLERTLKSVDFESPLLFEMVIIDASDSLEIGIVRELASPYTKVRFYRQESVGLYAAMNEGLTKVSGEWVWFMNSGDVFANKDNFGLLTNLFNNCNAEVYVGGHFVFGPEDENRAMKTVSKREGYASLKSYAYERQQTNQQSTIYRRRALESIGAFNTKWTLCADYESVLAIREKFGPQAVYFFKEIVSGRESGGVSDTRLIEVAIQKFQIRNRFLKHDLIVSFLWLCLHLSYYVFVSPQANVRFRRLRRVV